MDFKSPQTMFSWTVAVLVWGAVIRIGWECGGVLWRAF